MRDPCSLCRGQLTIFPSMIRRIAKVERMKIAKIDVHVQKDVSLSSWNIIF